jgi:hypothetical protein
MEQKPKVAAGNAPTVRVAGGLRGDLGETIGQEEFPAQDVDSQNIEAPP